jgi:hypothetical protein
MITIHDISGRLGIQPDLVASDLREHVDEFLFVPDDVALDYMRTVKLGRAHHDLLHREHADWLAARGEQRTAACDKAYAETFERRSHARRNYLLKQLPREGDLYVMPKGERLTEREALARLQGDGSRREAREAALLAGENFDADHPSLEFTDWIQTRDGKAARARADAAIAKERAKVAA